MHIERMHKMIECLTEKALCEFDKGIENIDTCEMGQVVDMIKDLNEAEYKAVIVKSMKEAYEEEKEYDKELLRTLKAECGEEGGRRYYDAYRYANGRFAPKGKGTRRGYIEPPYYHQMPDDYRTWEDKPMQERMRDLDRMSGRMHYTEPTTATRDSREGKSGMMRRSYIEAKEMHKDKDTTMQELEKYLKGVSEDITDVIGSMTPEERSMLKSKMSTLVTKL